MFSNVVETVLKRDRLLVMAGLAGVIILAWLYLIRHASGMIGIENDMSAMSMPMTQAWQIEDIFLIFVMWAVMMVAMMTPSASPIILMFVKVHRQRQADQTPFPSVSGFLLGYLIVWFSFSAGAALVQWRLHSVALLSDETIRISPLFGGILLILAGFYQFTPLKNACLVQCRTPLSFLLTEWRDGTKGALIMGIRHGAYCVGCCWLLMILLFVGGVMNLLWVALIAVYVLAEKVIPAGQLVSRTSGLLAIGWGIWLVVHGLGK